MQHTSMLAACMYGLAVGDALGVPYEFRLRDTFRVDGYLAYGTHNQPAAPGATTPHCRWHHCTVSSPTTAKWTWRICDTGSRIG